MSVKLSRYIFRRIGGRIVPIRRTLEMAEPAVSEAAAKVAARGYRHTAKGLEKLGKGVDFDVFKIKAAAQDLVLKIPASNPSRAIKSKKLIEAIPNINDKVARAQALGANLPNFGIPTVESYSVRISKKLKGLVQPFVDIGTSTRRNPNGMTIQDAARNLEIARREANSLSFKTGLRLDAHAANITHRGELVDTALGSPLPTYKTITQAIPQRMIGSKAIVSHSDPTMAKELLDGGYYGSAPKHFKRADAITERAALEGPSQKITRAFRALRKQGFRLQPGSKDAKALELISPAERVARAEAKGIKFVKQNGKLTVKKRGV